MSVDYPSSSALPRSLFGPGTRGRDHADLLSEIGDLHLLLKDQEKELASLRRLRDWLIGQAIISTPSVCCSGGEIEKRILELEALFDMKASREIIFGGGING